LRADRPPVKPDGHFHERATEEPRPGLEERGPATATDRRTIICFALIAASILSSSILISSAEMSVSTGKDRLGADIAIVPSGYENISSASSSGMMGAGAGDDNTGQLALLMADQSNLFLNGSELEEIRAVPGVAQASPQVYAPSPLLLITRLVGFDPQSDFTIQPWVSGEVRPLHNGEAILGSAVALKDSTTLSVFGRQFNITERLERSGTALDTSMFLRLDDLYSLSSSEPVQGRPQVSLDPGQVSAILVKLEPATDRYDLAENITAAVPGTYAVASSALRSTMADRFTAISSSLSFTALVVVLVVVPQVALVSAMVSNERRGEFGLLRALGGTKRFIFGVVFTETILLAAVGGSLGTAGTILGLQIIQTQLGSAALGPFLWPSAGALAISMFMALASALAVGGISAIYPAYASSRQEPYDAIRKGGGR
jgi:putative ABC transport system permease protein